MPRFLLLFLLLPVLLIGQKHDHVWLFGYDFFDNPQDSLYGTSIIDFGKNPIKVFYDGNKRMDFLKFNLSFSDENGNFLFSGEGHWLENFENESIDGDDFNTASRDLFLPNTCLVVPLEEDNQFGYFHSNWGWNGGVCGKEWWYSKIDMNENNGLGKVVSKERILRDDLETSKVMGVKHANGKDWWFLTKKFSSNNFYKIFFDGNSFEITNQIVGSPVIDGLGQACFSPDGTQYVTVSSMGSNLGRYFDLYDFDRCTGELSNHVQVHKQRDEFSGGIAFSPNSRFLYISDNDRVLQYDTWEQNISESEVVVAESDGFKDTVGSSIIIPSFYLMQLAPNDKIYINSIAGTHYLHTIESPNEKGLACNLKQHSLRLPTPNFTIPTFPNYRLGALVGSPCDTINLSSNSEIKEKHKIKISPNPANHQLHIEIADNFSKSMVFHLFDINGIKVKSVELTSSFQRVNLDGLAAGLFFYQILENGRLLKADKVVIMR